jgi:hypothetical protein
VVVYLGTGRSTAGTYPVVSLRDSAGAVWQIRGESDILRIQIEKAHPRLGDTLAVSYFATLAGRSQRPYENYKAVVRAVRQPA